MNHDSTPPLPAPLQVLCYLDRTNLAYAALQLNERLGFSEVKMEGGGGRDRRPPVFFSND
jgi:hypothetical protein